MPLVFGEATTRSFPASAPGCTGFVASLLSVPEPNVPTTVGLAGLLTLTIVMSAAPIT